jgi:hypothetical protein
VPDPALRFAFGVRPRVSASAFSMTDPVLRWDQADRRARNRASVASASDELARSYDEQDGSVAPWSCPDGDLIERWRRRKGAARDG